MNNQQHLTEVAGFLREHRNNESHFDVIFAKLEEECNNGYGEELQSYTQSLQELKEKEADAYQQIKETGAQAYPQFEKFVSGFEKAVTAAVKELDKS